MNINRHNYEEFFLMYVDNELTPAERTAVEMFINENPDLRAELEMFQDTVMQPEEKISFGNIQSLLKKEEPAGAISDSNCEEHFVLYGDNELNNKEKDLVEQFVYRNPQHQASFELIQQARLTPDNSIVFPDKSVLYRHEKGERVIVMRWFRVAAAAAVILLAGGYAWYNMTNDPDGTTGQVAGSVNQATVSPNRSNNPAVTPNTGSNTTTLPTQESTVTTTPGEETIAATNTGAAGKRNTGIAGTTEPSTTETAKIDPPGSNPTGTTNVSQEVPTVEPPIQTVAIAGNVDMTPAATVTTAVVAATNLQTTQTNITPTVYNGPDGEENTTNTKKGFRGLLRKVARTLDKATTTESGEDDKGGIRIASFSFASK
ncbi:MAG: hypothetical protein QM731_18285 [Chitinophagaceae bacterium]